MVVRRVLNEAGAFVLMDLEPAPVVEKVITPEEKIVEKIEADLEEVPEMAEKLPKDLMEWTKSQLLDHCAWLGVEANGGLNKQSIIDRIENANKASL